MAESDPEPEVSSDKLIPRHSSTSLFGIPNFLQAFGTTKGSSDSDSIRSPTSPLDIGVFSSFRKPLVSIRYARSSSEKECKKDWNWSKVVGLGIVNSLVHDSVSEPLGSPKRNIIFGPQVRPNSSSSIKSHHGSLDSPLRSKSLPTNYVASRLSQTKCLSSQLSGKNLVFNNEEIPFEKALLCFSDSNVPSSLASLTHNQCSDSSSPLEIGSCSGVENYLEVKPSTVPIPIGPSQGLVGSLSAREIELSEDYTCIISHGPNPKTIHIFSDTILECHENESSDFGNNEELRSGLPRVANGLEMSIPVHSDEASTFCHTCKRKLEEGEEVYISRGDKAFCSFDCSSGNIFEEETEIGHQKDSVSSHGSSFHEDLFLLGMPIAM